VFKAHRRLYHSTLGLRVIEKKKVSASFSDERSWACVEGSLPSPVRCWRPEVLCLLIDQQREAPAPGIMVYFVVCSCCTYSTN